MVLQAVANPDYIVEGKEKEKLAVKFFQTTLHQIQASCGRLR